MVPIIGGVFLVSCGDAAADETCAELQDLEARVVDAEEDEANQVLAETYADMSDLAERTEGELGDAMTDLQPLLHQLEVLTGDDEQAAAEAQDAVAELSKEELADIDEAADTVNDTCDLSVLL